MLWHANKKLVKYDSCEMVCIVHLLQFLHRNRFIYMHFSYHKYEFLLLIKSILYDLYKRPTLGWLRLHTLYYTLLLRLSFLS